MAGTPYPIEREDAPIEEEPVSIKPRLFLDRVLDPYDGSKVGRFICEISAEVTSAPSLRATSALGLPIVGDPVVVREEVRGDKRRIEISVSSKTRMRGIRLEVGFEHEGKTLRDRIVCGRSMLRRARLEWLEERRNASNWDGYDAWFRETRADDAELERERTECSMWEQDGSFYPLVSIITPVFRTPAPYLKRMIDSVIAQTYPRFELVIVNVSGACDEVDDVLLPYVTGAHADSRVRLIATPTRSIAENTNVGINVARGAYVCFVDHDDFIEPDTLYRYVAEIRRHPEADLLYCNEDMWTDDAGQVVKDIRESFRKAVAAESWDPDVDPIDERGTEEERISAPIHPEDGLYFNPKFKGSWDLDRLFDGNTVCHMLMASRRALGFTTRTPGELSGAQDYDLTLKVAEVAREIRFIPHMLYHWRSHEGSTATDATEKDYLLEAGKAAVASYYARRGIVASLGEVDYPLLHRSHYKLPSPEPRASVIVVARSTDEGASCIRRVLATTNYDDYEIVVVAPDEDVLDLAAGRVRAVSAAPDSSWSMRANFGCERATGDILAIVDGGAVNFAPDWLQVLAERLMRNDVAIAAPLVLDADGMVGSCGVTIDADGSTIRMSQGLSPRDTGYMQYLLASHTASAVSHACLALKRTRFEDLGGFDERFATGVSVAALCLRARDLGLASVVAPYAPVTWVERVTAQEASDLAFDRGILLDIWPLLTEADPMLDPTLVRDSPFYQLPEQLV
ncbi:MAG: glycosyltransferase [Atopobiaceae bacterium]|nr:glycosyltransferase [Atopobiaceae bacterium]